MENGKDDLDDSYLQYNDSKHDLIQLNVTVLDIS
jgi:hypothetical protein